MTLTGETCEFLVEDDGAVGLGRPLDSLRREEQLLPSLTLEWDTTENVSMFVSARMANKLGGFDARSSKTPIVRGVPGLTTGTWEFEDEQALTYEMGANWYLPAGLGELKAVAFYTDYTDLQLTRFDGIHRISMWIMQERPTPKA